MRILAVSHACVVDVNQQLLVELAKHQDVELTLVAPERWKSDIRGDVDFRALDDLQADVRPLPVALSGRINLHWYPGVGRALRGERFDVAYLDEEAFSVVAYQFLRLKSKLGARLLVHGKQNIYCHYPFPFSWMQRQVLARSECLAAANEEGREVLLRKGRPDPIPVIPFAVDPALFHEQDGSERRAALGLDRFVIGYVGRLTPEKGIHDLMSALEKLWADEGLDFQALFVGSGPLEDEVRGFAERMGDGKVVMQGVVSHDEVPEVMSCVDVLALPSRTTPRWKEQFGRVIIEAMCCGVPVVGSDSGEIPILLKRLGASAVFRECDVEDLAAKLRTAIEEHDRLCGQLPQARERIESAYSYRAVASQLHGVCCRVAHTPLC